MSVDFRWTARYIPEDETVSNHHCEKLRSYTDYYRGIIPSV
jgi:hypothetical protein